MLTWEGAVGAGAGVRVDEYTSWFHYEFWLGAARQVISEARIKELWVRARGTIEAKHRAALCELVTALPDLELLVVDEAVVELMGSTGGHSPFPECPSRVSVHVSCGDTLQMVLPEVCSNPGHILWPSWRAQD